MTDRAFEICIAILGLILTLAPFAIGAICVAWVFNFLHRWQKDRATRRELDEAMLAKLKAEKQLEDDDYGVMISPPSRARLYRPRGDRRQP